MRAYPEQIAKRAFEMVNRKTRFARNGIEPDLFTRVDVHIVARDVQPAVKLNLCAFFYGWNVHHSPADHSMQLKQAREQLCIDMVEIEFFSYPYILVDQPAEHPE